MESNKLHLQGVDLETNWLPKDSQLKITGNRFFVRLNCENSNRIHHSRILLIVDTILWVNRESKFYLVLE